VSNAISLHINELKNATGISQDELDKFLNKFELLANSGIHSNAIFYILNLHTLKYEYVNNVCLTFTGYDADSFKNKGIHILQDIMVAEDYKVLSESLFPKMNMFTQQLTTDKKASVVFEVHYRLKHKETNVITSIVEYSSYAKFDRKSEPTVSTGICYESVLDFNGVRGIVRLKREQEQETIFDETIHHTIQILTNKEMEVAVLLNDGKSRKEIACKLFISQHTVNSHVKNVYRKLHINKVSDLKLHI